MLWMCVLALALNSTALSLILTFGSSGAWSVNAPLYKKCFYFSILHILHTHKKTKQKTSEHLKNNPASMRIKLKQLVPYNVD